MGMKIALTGVIFAALLLIPGMTRSYGKPPTWVMAIILVPGFIGLFMILVGLIIAVWQA